MDLSSRSTLITGAGSGIGRALAVALAAKGAHLTLFGRRRRPLEEAARLVKDAGGKAQIVSGDVTSSEAREQAIAAAVERFSGLDILVNNAGCVCAGRLETMDINDIRTQLEVNLVAPILLTRAALPALRRSGEAAIVNMSSAVALIGSAFYAPYVATKAGLALFSEALRRELYGEGIHVLTVYPNATRTPMMETTLAGPELGFNYEPAEAVAEAIVAGLEAGVVEVVRDAEKRAALLAANRERPAEVDARLARKKHLLEAAVANHRSIIAVSGTDEEQEQNTLSSEWADARAPQTDRHMETSTEYTLPAQQPAGPEHTHI